MRASLLYLHITKKINQTRYRRSLCALNPDCFNKCIDSVEAPLMSL